MFFLFFSRNQQQKNRRQSANPVLWWIALNFMPKFRKFRIQGIFLGPVWGKVQFSFFGGMILSYRAAVFSSILFLYWIIFVQMSLDDWAVFRMEQVHLHRVFVLFLKVSMFFFLVDQEELLSLEVPWVYHTHFHRLFVRNTTSCGWPLWHIIVVPNVSFNLQSRSSLASIPFPFHPNNETGFVCFDDSHNRTTPPTFS